jgi:hypothetical protein
MAALGPSDLPAVFECLRSALSHDPTTQKQAETTLRELESRPGFCSCLAVRDRRCKARNHHAPALQRKPGDAEACRRPSPIQLQLAAATGHCPPTLRRSPGCCRLHLLFALQEILASKDADHSARWLAAVHFKNSCNKYWRSRLPG